MTSPRSVLASAATSRARPGTKTEASTRIFAGLATCGAGCKAGCRAGCGAGCGAGCVAGTPGATASWPVRTICKRSSRRPSNSWSMACGSPAMPLTLTILSPGSSTRSAAPLLPHCLFQASAAPPGSTHSMRRFLPLPLCEVVMPSSAPSATRSVSPKTNASSSSEPVGEKASDPAAAVGDGAELAGPSAEVMPRTSASETFAGGAAGAAGCEGAAGAGVGQAWDGKGKAGTSASFLSSAAAPNRHISSMAVGLPRAPSLPGERRPLGA
mmetsp:Transcript_8185/g.24070  ORF Transcript_8185/g.24070 Transcript_8185/m.24070 type:complete len:269 (-) Transcript_8185:476-1282(-)